MFTQSATSYHKKAKILCVVVFLHSAGYYATPNEMFSIHQVQKLPCRISKILIINFAYIFKIWQIGESRKQFLFLLIKYKNTLNYNFTIKMQKYFACFIIKLNIYYQSVAFKLKTKLELQLFLYFNF